MDSKPRIKKTREENNVKIHQLAYDRESVLDSTRKIRRCEVGFKSGFFSEKVLLVVGETGAGKTTVISAIANYLLRVKWSDNFRYELLVDEQEKKSKFVHHKSQTKWITAYTFYHTSNFPIEHHVTVVDTPGYLDTDKGDEEITRQILRFFSMKQKEPSGKEKDTIDHIDAVVFVLKANNMRLGNSLRSVFLSVLSLFGKDIAENIFLFTTFAEVGGTPKVLSAVMEMSVESAAYYTFNNVALFSGKTGDKRIDIVNEMMWEMSEENLEKHFKDLSKVTPVAIDQSKTVLLERQSLNTILDGLPNLIRSTIVVVNNLQKEKSVFLEHIENIGQDSKDFTYEIIEEEIKRAELIGEEALICPNCKRTCHYPCNHPIRIWCSAFYWFAILRGCSVCEDSCSLFTHKKVPYTLERHMVKKIKRRNDLKRQYESTKAGERAETEKSVKKIDAAIEGTKQKLHDQVEKARGCLTRLKEIALRPNTKSLQTYLEDIMQKECKGREVGWEDRCKEIEYLIEKEKLNSEDSAATPV